MLNNEKTPVKVEKSLNINSFPRNFVIIKPNN